MSYCGEGVGRRRGRQGRREARDQKMYTEDLLEVGCFWVSPPSPLTASPCPMWTCWRPAHSQAPLGILGTPFVTLLMKRSFGLAPGAHLNLLHPCARGRRQRVRWAWWQRWWMAGEGGKGHLFGPELWAGEGAPTACPPTHTQARLVSEQRIGPWSLAAGPCQQEMRCGYQPQP